MKKLLLLALFSGSTVVAQCWQNINTGGATVHGVKTDGTLWGWGLNNVGEVGDGNTTDKNVTTQVGTATGWKSTDLLGFHTIALKTNGSMWTWGANAQGQLGNGTVIDHSTPIDISNGFTWTNATAGVYHSAAIRSDGTLWAWGQNNKGQLGDGTLVNKTTPVQVGTANDWKSVSAGWEFTLAIKNNGTLWAWGANNHGQLGNGTLVNSSVPVQVGTLDNWATVDAGFGFNLALKTNGTIWIWAGYSGEYTANPQQIGTDTDWRSISGGDDHYAAVKLNGTLWASGENTYGQLGNGTINDSATLIQIGTLTDWKDVFADGYQFTIGLKNNGDLWAWGQNLSGQLANGNFSNLTYPIEVNCPVPLSATTFSEAVAVSVYPNPVQSTLFIKNNTQKDISKVTVYDMYGHKVAEKNAAVSELNVQDLPSGVYFIEVVVDNTYHSSMKFMKD